MPILLIPVLAAVVGLLLYALTTDKLAEAGRLLFFAGILVALSASVGHVTRLP